MAQKPEITTVNTLPYHSPFVDKQGNLTPAWRLALSQNIVPAINNNKNSDNSTTSALLTGFILGDNTPISATDTVLSAFEKLQGQMTSSGSHSPVTLGTPANGLSLLGQQLSLGLSSSTNTGALSNSDWNTFNNNIPIRIPISGNYTITGINNQRIVVTGLASNLTITLPSATTANQTIEVVDETGNCIETLTITVISSGTDMIERNTYHILNYPYASIKLECNGSGKWVVITNANINLSAGTQVQPSFTDNGNGSCTLGTGTYALYANPDGIGKIKAYILSGNTFTLTDTTINYVVADFNSGTPLVRVVTDVTLINETTVIPIYTIYRQGNTLYDFGWDDLGDGLINKVHQSIVKTQRYRLQPGGLVLSEAATRLVLISSGVVWTGAVPTNLAAFNSSTNPMIFCYHVAGVWTYSTVTQYNNTQYDDGTNLQTVNPNRYAVNFIYRGVGNDTDAFIVLGSGNYQISDAIASQPPANLPPLISSHAILIGRIIVQQNASVATQIDSAFNTLFVPAGITDHNSLANIQVAPNPVSGQYYHLSSVQATIATQAATSLLSGYLSNTDWSTFNSKEPAITVGTITQYWRGDKTWQTLNTSAVSEGTNLYYTDTRAISAPLTGYVVGSNTVLAATDTILGAFGKVQAQINAVPGTVTSVAITSANGFAGTVATATTTPAITLSTTITGLLKGNGTAISAATSGTDFQAPYTILSTLGTLASTAGYLYNDGTGILSYTAPVATVSSTDDTTTNATYYPAIFTAAGGSVLKTSSTKLSFNPSTGLLTSTALATGALSATSGTFSSYNTSTTHTQGLLIANTDFTAGTRAGILFQNGDNLGAVIWSPRTGGTSGNLYFGVNTGGTTAESSITEVLHFDNTKAATFAGALSSTSGTFSQGIQTGASTSGFIGQSSNNIAVRLQADPSDTAAVLQWTNNANSVEWGRITLQNGSATFDISLSAAQFNGSGAGLTGTASSLNAGSVTYLINRTDTIAYPILWGANYTNGSGTIAYSCAAVTIQSSTGTIGCSALTTGAISATSGTFSGPVEPGPYTVAALPPTGTNGQMVYATNARKTGEGSGAGTGLLLIYTNGAWRDPSQNYSTASV